MTTQLMQQLLGFPEYRYTKEDHSFPLYNIFTSEKGTTFLEVALPKFKKENIEVRCEDSKLIISAPKLPNEDNINYVRKGFSTKAFTRAFVLHPNIEITDVYFTDGVLTVVLAKKADPRDRVFKINETRKIEETAGKG